MILSISQTKTAKARANSLPCTLYAVKSELFIFIAILILIFSKKIDGCEILIH
jgi:hypothetical protein